MISFDPTMYSSAGDDITNDPETSISYSIDDSGQGLDYITTGDYMTFAFNSEGEYTITFTGQYADGTIVDRIYYINISMPELAWDFDINVPKYAKQNETIILPDLTASQGNLKADVSVKVLDPDGLTPESGDAIRYQNGDAMVWSFTTNENTRGTYKVTYTAKTDYGEITKTFEIKVGDNVAPTFNMNYESELSQEIVYDGTNQIEYNINLNKTNRTLIIEVISNGKTIYSYDTKLVIKDKNDNGTESTMTNWNSLTVELASDDGIVSKGDEDGQYIINGTGKCTLTLTVEDSYDNVGTKKIEFNVVSETEPEENKDSYLGVVLIIVSLVILAGVILFFTFTGKKGGSSKQKKMKNNSSVDNSSKSKKVEDKKDLETKVNSDNDNIELEKDDEVVIDNNEKDNEINEDNKPNDESKSEENE